jgi:O-methyltransferase
MSTLRSKLRTRLLSALNAPPAVRPAREDDFDATFQALVAWVKPFTMTSPERLYGLHEACDYLLREDVPGDFVECGVWRGGSSMVMSLALAGVDGRRLWLYDTFEGMVAPDERDGELANRQWVEHQSLGKQWARSPLEEVQHNIALTGLPADRVNYVAGKVQDTIPATAPEQIALLRLDTDWYESTRHELEHLWDRLSWGGVLIIDDYGHYEGSRRATDEFFAARSSRPLLSRLDYTGRLAVKTR